MWPVKTPFVALVVRIKCLEGKVNHFFAVSNTLTTTTTTLMTDGQTDCFTPAAHAHAG